MGSSNHPILLHVLHQLAVAYMNELLHELPHEQAFALMTAMRDAVAAGEQSPGVDGLSPVAAEVRAVLDLVIATGLRTLIAQGIAEGEARAQVVLATEVNPAEVSRLSGPERVFM